MYVGYLPLLYFVLCGGVISAFKCLLAGTLLASSLFLTTLVPSERFKIYFSKCSSYLRCMFCAIFFHVRTHEHPVA